MAHAGLTFVIGAIGALGVIKCTRRDEIIEGAWLLINTAVLIGVGTLTP